MKELYWKYMVQVKVWELYLKAYMQRTYRWDRTIQIFTAVTSSSSIAAWAVWQQLSYLWAGIIAVSQILTAVKSFLPFGERLKLLPELKTDITSLYTMIEAGWYPVSRGMEETEIHDRIYEYKNRLTEIQERHIKGMILPERADLLKAAEKEAEEYFRLYFPQAHSGRYVRQGSINGNIPSIEGLPEMETEIACPE